MHNATYKVWREEQGEQYADTVMQVQLPMVAYWDIWKLCCSGACRSRTVESQQSHPCLVTLMAPRRTSDLQLLPTDRLYTRIAVTRSVLPHCHWAGRPLEQMGWLELHSALHWYGTDWPYSHL